MNSSAYIPSDAPKNAALAAITRMNDSATFEEIMHEVYVLQKIEQGRRDVATGRTYSQEEMRKEMQAWRN